jgi:hypothetical protein
MDFYSQTTSNPYDRTPNEGKATANVVIDWQRMQTAKATPDNPYGTENTDNVPKGALVYGLKAALRARTNLTMTPAAATASVAFAMIGGNPMANIEKFNQDFHERCCLLGIAAYGVEGSRLNSPPNTPTSFTVINAGTFDYPTFHDVHAGQAMEAFWLRPDEYLEQRNTKFIGPVPILQLRPITQKRAVRLYAPGDDLFQTLDHTLYDKLMDFAVKSRAVPELTTVFSNDVNGFKIKSPLASVASSLCDLMIQRRIETTPTLSIRCVKGALAGRSAKFVIH